MSDESLPPTEVIRAILRAPVDLLWNGGIGTVVKASTETDADAARPQLRRDPRQCERAAREGRGRGRQPRLHASRAGRVRGRRRAHQRRLHRQLGRRRLLRPRGQPEDPARAGRAGGRADARGARRAAARGHRRRRRARALRLVPAGADHRPGGRPLRLAAVRLRGPDHAARGGRDPRPQLRGPAVQRGARRAPPRGPRDGAAGAGGPGRLLQAAAGARAGAHRLRRGAVARARPARLLPARRRQALRLPAEFPSAQAPADLHGQLERGRERARPDVRVAAGRRARRRAGRRRARVPDRARGDRRRCAVGGRRAARRRRPRGATRVDGRRRRSGRRDHPLVSDK